MSKVYGNFQYSKLHYPDAYGGGELIIVLIIVLILIGSGIAYLFIADKKQSNFEKEFWLERSYEVAEKCNGECGMCRYEWCSFRKRGKRMRMISDTDQKSKDLECWRYCDDNCYRCEKKDKCEIAKMYREEVKK
jgi:hypothetical protein